MRDWELLAIKLALDKWMHWLEEQPFIIWTNHKNLSYLHLAKRLNKCQARWVLFILRFNFSVTYCPGSHNIKYNSLSRQFFSPDGTSEEETILPPSCVIAFLTWQTETLVRKAQRREPDPGPGPYPDIDPELVPVYNLIGSMYPQMSALG